MDYTHFRVWKDERGGFLHQWISAIEGSVKQEFHKRLIYNHYPQHDLIQWFYFVVLVLCLCRGWPITSLETRSTLKQTLQCRSVCTTIITILNMTLFSDSTLLFLFYACAEDDQLSAWKQDLHWSRRSKVRPSGCWLVWQRCLGVVQGGNAWSLPSNPHQPAVWPELCRTKLSPEW